jgi:hypothetical protein
MCCPTMLDACSEEQIAGLSVPGGLAPRLSLMLNGFPVTRAYIAAYRAGESTANIAMRVS